MPYSPDPSSPAALRFSRTPKTKVAASGITTGGVVTVASGALDPWQNGDYCTVTEATAGTAITGAASAAIGGLVDKVFSITKLTATTAQLTDIATGAAPTVSAAVTTNAALQFGSLPTSQGILSRNIVPAGSVAGGAFGTPLD